MRKTKNNKKHKTLSKIRHKLYSKRKGRGVGASKLSARLARIPSIPSIRSVKTQTKLVKTQKQLDEEYEMTFVRMKDVLNRTNDALAEAETLRYHRDLFMERSNTALVRAQSAIAEAERTAREKTAKAAALGMMATRAAARAAMDVAEEAVVEWKTVQATAIESALTAAESAIAAAEVAVEAREAMAVMVVAAKAARVKEREGKPTVASLAVAARQAAEDAVSVWKKLTSEEVTFGYSLEQDKDTDDDDLRIGGKAIR